MNIIEKAIKEVRSRIPEEILDLAFRRTDYSNRILPINIETKVKELVIKDRVLVDMNIVGGEQVLIDISTVTPEWIEPPYSAVFKIPKKLTRGKSISSTLSISYGNIAAVGNGYQAQYNTSSMMDAANEVLQSQLNIPMVSTASLELIGDNVIFVRDTMSIPTMLWLRCIIENDENLNNINLRYALDFCRMVELATKAYIYNTLNIKLDLGQLHGGMNLGKVREVVDGYSDAQQMYDDFMEENWRKMSLLSDHESRTRHLRMVVGGGY